MKYEPYEYQTYATRFIEEKPESAIFLDCGLGKTSITLTAIDHLMFDSFDVHRVLVIAPVRVAKFSWPDELKKWDHLSDLTFAVAVGTPKQRMEALESGADITIINRENVQWLVEKSGYRWDFDMCVLDEASSFRRTNMLDKNVKEIRVFTRGEAIRKKCLDCCCGNTYEVAQCPVYDCPLWPYRLSSHTRSMKYTPKDFSIVDCRAYSTNHDSE